MPSTLLSVVKLSTSLEKIMDVDLGIPIDL